MVKASEITVKDERRFWSKVDIRGENECWLWTKGKKGPPGWLYGAFWLNGRLVGGHEVAFVLANDKDTGNLCVLHTCNTPACCNPKHLELGTHGQNMAWMAQCGRAASGSRNGKHTHPEKILKGNKSWFHKHRFVGLSNNQTRLYEFEVAEIRNFYATGQFSQQDLADIYKVNQTLVSAIVRRTARKYVQ